MDEGTSLSGWGSHDVVKAYLHSGLGTMSSREWLTLRRPPRAKLSACGLCESEPRMGSVPTTLISETGRY